VVGISSGASVTGSRGWNAYSLSKASFNMLIDLYSKENENTHFSALAPGLIDSKMQDYIYSLPENDKFPVLKKLHDAKGTSKMPPAEKAAMIISDGIEKAKNYGSGEYLDVRNM
jgi:NAD(P)-dependent dehydrogenase (short-subunit alcohol dehydrogenase family)